MSYWYLLGVAIFLSFSEEAPVFSLLDSSEVEIVTISLFADVDAFSSTDSIHHYTFAKIVN